MGSLYIQYQDGSNIKFMKAKYCVNAVGHCWYKSLTFCQQPVNWATLISPSLLLLFSGLHWFLSLFLLSFLNLFIYLFSNLNCTCSASIFLFKSPYGNIWNYSLFTNSLLMLTRFGAGTKEPFAPATTDILIFKMKCSLRTWRVKFSFFSP